MSEFHRRHHREKKIERHVTMLSMSFLRRMAPTPIRSSNRLFLLLLLSCFVRQGWTYHMVVPRRAPVLLRHDRSSRRSSWLVRVASSTRREDESEEDRSSNSSSDCESESFPFPTNNDTDTDDDEWLASLNHRAQQLAQQRHDLVQHWTRGDCHSTLALVVPDWVRRLDVDYPLVVCGSSQETLYLGHLETGQILAQTTSSSQNVVDDNDKDDDQNVALQQTLRYLYGSYDGGGTLSIAFSGSLICEGTRRGGVRVWRRSTTNNHHLLISQGSIPALQGQYVTCLKFHDHGTQLWVGTHTGNVHVYALDHLPLALQTTPQHCWKLDGCILSIDLASDYECGVATVAGGSVHLFSTKGATKKTPSTTTTTSGTVLATLYPPFDSSERRSANIYPTHACFVQTTTDAPRGTPDNSNYQTKNNDDDNDETATTTTTNGLSLVCGGSNGSMYCQRLALTVPTTPQEEDTQDHDDDDDDTPNGPITINPDQPLVEPLESMGLGHFGGGLIKALVSPSPDMVVSLGQDGCVRIWNLNTGKPHYSFQGYKVWAGSLWTDGQRLVSDGADNCILMHDFGKPHDQIA